MWKRGADPLAAPVIFEIDREKMACWAAVDQEDPAGRVLFVGQTDFYNYDLLIGTLTGAVTKIDLPSNAWAWWHRGWLAIQPRTEWTVGDVTYPAGSLLGIGLDAFLAGSRALEVLFTPGPRRICSGFTWVADRLLATVMDDLQPRHEIFTPSATGWARDELDHLPQIGVVGVSRLDEDPLESDGALLANVQDPLTPATLLLTSTSSATPMILKRAPTAFDANGLAVTRHEAISIDGERIPYVQVGPIGETGDAPVHMSGYGGFNVSEAALLPQRHRQGLAGARRHLRHHPYPWRRRVRPKLARGRPARGQGAEP